MSVAESVRKNKKQGHDPKNNSYHEDDSNHHGEFDVVNQLPMAFGAIENRFHADDRGYRD